MKQPKYDIQEVKESFKNEGYTVTKCSDIYKNGRQKIEYLCPQKHNGSTNWFRWKQGVRCSKCRYQNNANNNRKYNVEYVKKSFESEEYKIIDCPTSYERVSQFFKYLCPFGHEGKITWGNWKQGHRCRVCQDQKNAINNRKYTISDIVTAFQNEGYQVVNCPTTFINSFQYFGYICPKGHEGKIQWSVWQRGVRCQKCGYVQNAINNRKYTISDVVTAFQNEGYRVTDCPTTFINSFQYFNYICPKGHVGRIMWYCWVQGERCGGECKKEKAAASLRKYTLQDIKQQFENEGYQAVDLPEKYLNNHQLFKYTCPHKHSGSIRWGSWLSGNRCGACTHSQSVSELEIGNLYRDLIPETKNRTILAPKEVDLYFPTQKVAIEYCGLYWHSDAQKRMASGYHRDKLNKCNGQNIRLLTIFEDEWRDHKDICTSRISSALGIVQNKIYARKCIVKEISSKEARGFLSQTHLQGPGTCKIAYGLFYNDKIIQVMTLGSPARAHTSKGKRVLEMKRLAGELNMIVVGGASKIFKVALQYAKVNNYETIKSYCDLRWGTGNLYAKLGFTKTHETKYTPHYTDFKNRYRNQSLAQNKDKTKITEAEVAQQKGLYKIYDCGHQTWEYKI